MPAGDYEIRVLTRFDASGFQSYINEIRRGLASLATAGGASPAHAQRMVSQARAAAHASQQELQKYGRVDPRAFQGLSRQLESAFEQVINQINQSFQGRNVRGRIRDPLAQRAPAGVRAHYDEQMGLYVPNARVSRQSWARDERQRQASARRVQRDAEDAERRDARQRQRESERATRQANQGLFEYQRRQARGFGYNDTYRRYDAEQEAQRRREQQVRRGYLQQATTPLDLQRMGYLDAEEARQRAQRNRQRLAATTTADLQLAGMNEAQAARQREIQRRARLDSTGPADFERQGRNAAIQARQRAQAEAARIRNVTPEDLNRNAVNQVNTELQRAAQRMARMAAIGNTEGGEQAYYRALGEAAAAKREEAARTRAATMTSLSTNQNYIDAQATGELAQQREALAQRVSVLRQQLAMSQEELVQQRLLVAEEAQLARQMNDRIRTTDRSLGRGGTLFQRGMAWAQQRRTGTYVDPESQQRFGQFFGRHALNTLGYAVPGLLLYGGIQQFRMMVEESMLFGQQMSGVQTQLQAMGQGHQFSAMRDNILQVSSATGATAVEVANLSQSFLGLYQNVSQANQATGQAAAYLEAVGANIDQATPAMRAGAGAYNIMPGQLSNYAESLRQATGIAPFGPETGAQSLQFFADMAPTASLFNLRALDVRNIGVAALRYSAQSPENISVSLARILPGLASAKGLAQLGNLGYRFNQSAMGGNVISILQNMLQQTGGGRGQVPVTALKASGLFSERDFQTLEDLFGHPQQALQALGQTSINPNLARNRVNAYMQTPAARLHQFEQDIRNFGIALVNAGLGRVFADVATAAGRAAGVIGPVAHFFEDLNHAMGGIPGTILGLVAAWAILKKAFDVMGTVRQAGTDLATVLRGQAAATTVASGASTRAAGAEGTLAEADNVQAAAAERAAVAEGELAAVQGAGGAERAAQGLLGRARGGVGRFLGALGPRNVLRNLPAELGTGEGTLFGAEGLAAGAGTLIGGVGLAAGVGTAIGLGISRSGLGHWLENNAGRGTGAGVLASLLDPAAALGSLFGGHAATPRGAADPNSAIARRHAITGHEGWIQGSRGFFDGQGRFTAWAPGQQGNIAAAQAYARSHRNANRAAGQNTQAVGQMVQTLGDPSTDMQVLQQQFEAGTISWQQFSSQMTTNTARLQAIAAAQPNNVEAQQQAIQALQQQQQSIDQMNQARAQANTNLVNMTTGGVTSMGGLVAAQQQQAGVLRQAVMDAKSNSATQQAGVQFLQGLQQELQAQVSAALTPQQAQAIAKAGYVITPQDEQAIQRYYQSLGEQVPQQLQAGQRIFLDPSQQLQSVTQAAQDNISKMQTQLQLTQATTGRGDPVAQAEESVSSLQQQWASYLQNVPGATKDDRQSLQYQAQIAEAMNTQAEQTVQQANALLQMHQAQAYGDPLVSANMAVQTALANIQTLQKANYGPNSTEMIQANTALAQAYNQQAQAYEALNTAQAQVASSAAPYNQEAQIQAEQLANSRNLWITLAQAQDLVNRGLIQNVNQYAPYEAAVAQGNALAKRQLDYQQQLNTAQAAYAAAQYNLVGNRAAGDLVQLQAMRRNLQIIRSAPGGADPAAIASAQAQITAMQAQYAQDLIAQTQTRVQNELALQQISIGQAVAQLQALESVATSQQERQALQVQIRQLMQQATSQADLGTPEGGFVPTLYEVRRLAALGGTFGAAPPGGNLTAPVQNNYVVIQVNNPSDMAGAVSQFANVLSNSPIQSGTRVGVTSP